MIGSSRWRAHTRPLSSAGSCRPTPNRHAESTSADRGRRGVMAGPPDHRSGATPAPPSCPRILTVTTDNQADRHTDTTHWCAVSITTAHHPASSCDPAISFADSKLDSF